ncbi:MAG: SGNH/GDSL hydrolase family protein [Pseudomonadales bacterium]|nr:SGNH/GDSL hydrolase family protein [Pseudomonadales bacterium]
MSKLKLAILVFLSLIISGLFSLQLGAPEKPNTSYADLETYLEPISKLLLQTHPHNRIINIVTHGHSVPAGYFETPVVDTFNAYPHLMHHGLKSHSPNAIINVIVTGIGGESSDSGAARFHKEVLTHRPDVITIDYGLNDRMITLADARTSWIFMIEAALAKGIKVILLTPTLDTLSESMNPNDPLSLHAEQIRSLAIEYNVGLVDSFRLFNDYVKDGGSLNDLLSHINHPNRKGHELVAHALLQWFPTMVSSRLGERSAIRH